MGCKSVCYNICDKIFLIGKGYAMGQFDTGAEIRRSIMKRTFHYRNIFEPVGLKLIFDPTCFDPTLEQSSNFVSSDLGGTASCNP